jgi:hypothetical protein
MWSATKPYALADAFNSCPRNEPPDRAVGRRASGCATLQERVFDLRDVHKGLHTHRTLKIVQVS